MIAIKSVTSAHFASSTFSSGSRLMKRTLAAAVAALMIVSAVGHAQTINLPNNDSPTGPFGKTSTATYGQTFTTPTGFSFLQTFSFWLTNDAGLGAANSSSLTFKAYVMAWDAGNGRATGPVLYSSAVQSGPTLFSQRYDFASPNTLVNGGGQYVAFLSASGLFGSIPVAEATAGVESSFNGTYAGGQFVFADNGDNFGALSSQEWLLAGGFPEYQAHFNAVFSQTAVSVVPEPSSLVLLVAGLSSLLVLAVRKKRV